MDAEKLITQALPVRVKNDTESLEISDSYKTRQANIMWGSNYISWYLSKRNKTHVLVEAIHHTVSLLPILNSPKLDQTHFLSTGQCLNELACRPRDTSQQGKRTDLTLSHLDGWPEGCAEGRGPSQVATHWMLPFVWCSCNSRPRAGEKRSSAQRVAPGSRVGGSSSVSWLW